MNQDEYASRNADAMNDVINDVDADSAKPDEPCQHPATRLHAWYAGDTLCVCCNDCGSVLKGGVE